MIQALDGLEELKTSFDKTVCKLNMKINLINF
jgi:hypothetical protein